jgi:transcriptional regulator with XRE-family HTH domain
MSKEGVISAIEQHVINFVITLRGQKKVTQSDIGAIIGVSRSYVKDIESPKTNAKYNLKHIDKLADYFNISPKDFLPERSLIKNEKKQI